MCLTLRDSSEKKIANRINDCYAETQLYKNQLEQPHIAGRQLCHVQLN